MKIVAQEYVYSCTLIDGFRKEFTLDIRVSDDKAKRIADILNEDDIGVSMAYLVMRIRRMEDGSEQQTHLTELDALDEFDKTS